MSNVFQEGEPLNVAKLNEMHTDLLKLTGNFGAMTKASDIVDSVLGSTVPVITGKRETVNLKKNDIATISIADQLSKVYTGKTENPWIVVSLGSKLEAKDVISASIGGSGLQKTIYISSNVAREKFGIYWIAVFNRPVIN